MLCCTSKIKNFRYTAHLRNYLFLLVFLSCSLCAFSSFAAATAPEITAQDLAISLALPAADNNGLTGVDRPFPTVSLSAAQNTEPATASAPKYKAAQVAWALETEQEISRVTPRGHQHYLNEDRAAGNDVNNSVLDRASLALALRLNFM